jgi:REP element-mobilizing transposase RayT
VVQNWPHHVIQRGHNQRVVFRSDADARRQRAGSAKRDALWEGRYASNPIETEAYWLACGRYVGLNPVRARMVKRPEPYRWSSSRARAGLSAWTWLDRDPLSRVFPHAFTSLAHMTHQADFVTA